MQVAHVLPTEEDCRCPDCAEARITARATAVRVAAIRAYQRGQRSFALRFAEELLPGWDE